MEEQLKFDDAIKRLEALVVEMESGELDLDHMMKNFEEGRRLVGFCTGELESIRQRIDQVVKS